MNLFPFEHCPHHCTSRPGFLGVDHRLKVLYLDRGFFDKCFLGLLLLYLERKLSAIKIFAFYFINALKPDTYLISLD